MNEIAAVIKSKVHELRGQRVMLDFDLAQMYGVETKVLNQSVKRNIERFPEDFMFQLTRGEWEILKSQFATSNPAETDDGNSLGSQFATLNIGDNQDDSSLRSQIVTANVTDSQGDIVLRSQIVTAKQTSKQRFLPYAFTEQGVSMLSSVLRSPLAIQVNIGIMRAFVEMRHAISAIALPAKVSELEQSVRQLKRDFEDCLHDQNDINESIRAQLDGLSIALAELQSSEPKPKPRPRIGFV